MHQHVIRAFVLAPIAWFALSRAATGHATATLNGVVLLNELGGAPQAGVQVVADGATPTASDSTGRYVVGFPNHQPGDTVRLIVMREGWLVVNDIQLERELLRDARRRPVVILICKAGERERWALQFYRLKGRETVQNSYQRKLQGLEKAPAPTPKEREQLRTERDQALAQADDLACQLATVKVLHDEHSDTYRRALRLFVDGQLDQALGLLGDAQLAREATQAKQKLAEATQGYLLRGKLLALKLQFDEAAKAYEEATRLAPQSIDAWFAYAAFHQSLNHFDPAGKGYAQALEVAHMEGSRPGIATTLNNLGNLHCDENRPVEARQAYREALEIYEQFAATSPTRYSKEVERVHALIAGLPSKCAAPNERSCLRTKNMQDDTHLRL